MVGGDGPSWHSDEGLSSVHGATTSLSLADLRRPRRAHCNPRMSLDRQVWWVTASDDAASRLPSLTIPTPFVMQHLVGVNHHHWRHRNFCLKKRHVFVYDAQSCLELGSLFRSSISDRSSISPSPHLPRPFIPSRP